MYGLPITHDQIVRVSVTILAVVAVFSVLKIGAEIFAPLALALITGVMLAPIMDSLEKLKLPPAFAALLVLLGGMFLIVALAFIAEPLIWRIVEELPKIKWEVRAWIEEFRNIVRGLDEVNKQVEEALGTELNVKGEEDSAQVPSLSTALFLAPQLLAQILIFVGTLFFFLLTRNGIYAWMSALIGGAGHAEEVHTRFTTAEHLVSRYFLTITAINVGLGVALAVALSLIGLPGAMIWGVVAALLNYVLYLGPAVLVLGLVIAGILAFNGVHSFAPPLIFLFLNMIESQFATPSLIGKNISLNPLLIFVSLVFWLWLWGPVGGIIAIPVLLIAIALLDILEPFSDTSASQHG